jgi:predicted transposase/invertase (TIGR01784 family)
MDIEHDRAVSFSEGEHKGKLEGIIEGERKGKLEGIIEGELKGKLEVARNLLSNRVPLDVVLKSTGLSRDEIQTMKN